MRAMRTAGILVSIAACGGLSTPGLAADAAPQAAEAMPQAAAAPSAPADTKPTIQDGSTVDIDYTLTVDGEVVDSSEGRSPLSYVQGRGQLIPGLERELAGLSAGESRDVTLKPEDGYGPTDPAAFVTVSKAQLPPGVTPTVGMVLQGAGPEGQPFPARVYKIADDGVTLDLNHPLAGKTLQFKVTVVKVTAAP